MKATTLLLVTTLVGLALLSLPVDAVSPAGTAAAQICTPYLVHGDVEGYIACEKSRCEWDPKDLSMMCYD